MTRRTATLALLLAALAASPLWPGARPARADAGGAAGGVGGVGVVVTGEPTVQPQIAAQLETWLRSHGHELVPAPLPPEAINTLIDCFVIEDQECARKVVEMRAKSMSVVFATVSVSAGATALDRTVTLVAYWLDKGRPVIRQTRECKRCTDTTLRGTADDLMGALAGEGSDRGRIRVTSTPPGARVVVAGSRIGATPLDYSLPHGDHELTIEADGWVPAVRRVAIQRGQTAEVAVSLVSRSRPWPRAPLGLLAGGGAAVLAGGVLLLIDEDVEPTGPQEPTYRNTGPAGAVVLVAGVAAAGAGAFLLVRERRKAVPVAMPLPGGGASIGYAGSF